MVTRTKTYTYESVMAHLEKRRNKSLEDNLKFTYTLVRTIKSNSEEDKRIRGALAEFITKEIVDNIIESNPELNAEAMYGPIFSGNGKSTEIDSILITNIGVFSIEVKSFYGNYVIDSTGVFTRTYPTEITYNVLAQNSSHCRLIHNKIKDLIPSQNPYAVKGIIVLFGDCSFEDKRTDIEKEIYPICYPWELYKHINTKPRFVLEPDQIFTRLQREAKYDAQTRKNHIAYVNSFKRK